jgi:hypothetical protein
MRDLLIVILRLAGWMLPAEHRTVWKKKWLAGAAVYFDLTRDRQQWRGESRGKMLAYTAAALRDAAAARALPAFLKSPWLPIAIAVSLLCAIGLTSRFAVTRQAVQPPFQDVNRLGMIHETSLVFGRRLAVPPPLLEYWKRSNQSFEWLYGFRFRPGGRSLPLDKASPYLQSEEKGTRASGVIGKIKPGVTWEAAQNELISLAREHRRWRNVTPYPEPRLTPLADRYRHPLLSPAIIAGGTSLILLCIAFAGVYIRRGGHPRYWGYLAAKATLLPATLFFGLLEWTPANRITSTGGSEPIVELLFTWLLVLGCGAAGWWSIVDQQVRCRSCLMPLQNPIRIGFLGAILFNHAGTETVCCEGHGTLYTPETSSDYVQPGGWHSFNP